MRRLSHLSRLAALVPFALAIAACSEQLDGGAACPSLCPTENAPVRDTTLDAVILDSTLTGYPLPGEASWVLLSSRPRPDTLDARAIVRFDSLPAKYFPSGGADSVAITQVDSGYVTLHIDTTGVVLNTKATISAYDVDTQAGDDSSSTLLNGLFTQARLLGSVTIDSGGIKGDSVRVPISNAAIVAKATAASRLRIGFRIVSTAPVQLRIVSSLGGLVGNRAHLTFDPVSATDTTYSPLVVTPASGTPTSDPSIAASLHDFTIVAAGAVPPAGSDLVVGGLPARRTFLRFKVPSYLVDSSTIVRATLLLTQRPVPGALRSDTVRLESDVVVADQSIVDLHRTADLSLPGTSFSIDTLRLSPVDSGARSISIVNVVRAWKSLPATTQRAVVLRSGLEGAQAGALRFYSTEAAGTLRPRLRISYIQRNEFALP